MIPWCIINENDLEAVSGGVDFSLEEIISPVGGRICPDDTTVPEPAPEPIPIHDPSPVI